MESHRNHRGEPFADARAAQIKASLQRISWQAEDLAEALGVPREEKYDVWAALYGDDRTVFQSEPDRRRAGTRTEPAKSGGRPVR